MNDTVAFMRDLDQRYRHVSGLSERRFYSIFYCQPVSCPLMLLGYNPGGNPTNWQKAWLASQSFYENGEHEYVDFPHDSNFYRSMQTFLIKVLDLDSADAIRRIPKTNLIFRRSSQSGSGIFKKQQGVALSEAAREAQPFVEEILKQVQPSAILFEGKQTLELFEKGYCTEVETTPDGEPVTTPNGNNRALLYLAKAGEVRALGKKVLFVAIGHPSKFAARREWQEVIRRTRGMLSPVWRAPCSEI